MNETLFLVSLFLLNAHHNCNTERPSTGQVVNTTLYLPELKSKEEVPQLLGERRLLLNFSVSRVDVQ